MASFQDIMDREMKMVRSKFDNPDLYIDRELSWLQFNWRVLHHVTRKDVPLLERFKFLGITATNLDEFIMVRFASVVNKVLRDDMSTELSGLMPHEEYIQILDRVKEFKAFQEDGYNKLWKKLKKENIELVEFRDMNKDEREQVDKIFSKQIYPLLTPIAFDTTKAFPLIKSGQLNIIVHLEDNQNPNLNVLSIIPLDAGLPRIYELESKDGKRKFILLEDIITNNLDKVFINKPILYTGAMRILREADIELDHNQNIYIVDRMRQTLRKRELSQPIFMDIDNNMPKAIQRLLIKIFGIDKEHVYKCRVNVDLSFMKSLPIEVPHLQYKHFKPQQPAELIGEMDIFTAMDNGDIILHHPYESFDPVIKFLEHAADDKKVRAIKQTLYRVSSSESPIVEALCRAAKKGKQVSVLLEIKARFDEGRNISLIEKMESAGCKLIYGVEELKTHCKFIMVVREGNKGLKKYCHIGTGNYNEKSSGAYTDISYFTSNSKVGDDLLSVFNVLSGFSEPRDEISRIFYAPYNIRTRLYAMIDREIEFANKGKKAFITLKLNSLSDKGIIEKLYHAASKGVKISVICRGICSMKPIHKNISIKSIVGRYLEHSRIYYFYNNGKTEVFISSADMLTRNLDRRVELMVPIIDAEAREKVLGILSSYFRDNTNTYLMNAEGEYEKMYESPNVNIHDFFMEQAKENYKLRSLPPGMTKKKRT